MENGRHRVVKHFRFTETEAAKLRKLAKEFNMTESEYIRLLLNNKPSDYPEIRIMLSNLINEVNHVGNNINQIARKNNAGWRIDYFITSKDIENKIKQAVIYSEIYGSDHCPVGLEIEI